jgi:hypothetical protein
MSEAVGNKKFIPIRAVAGCYGRPYCSPGKNRGLNHQPTHTARSGLTSVLISRQTNVLTQIQCVRVEEDSASILLKLEPTSYPLIWRSVL